MTSNDPKARPIIGSHWDDSFSSVGGIPKGGKVVAIDGPLARRLADLALHKNDLTFALACLDAIPAEDRTPQREALWRSSIVHFIKCFVGGSARFQMQAAQVYKEEDPTALEVFDYFKALRDKHVVHDENSFAQCLPGAILNDGTQPHKIEKIVCVTVHASTLENDRFNNFRLLVQVALKWATTEFELLAQRLTRDLEVVDYSELAAKRPMVYVAARTEDIAVRRA